jgi:hypothetical protein
VFEHSAKIRVGTDLSETSDYVVYFLASHDGYSCFDTLSHTYHANDFHVSIFRFSGKMLEYTLEICYMTIYKN